ncbi:AraC family transcriptional regulator [Paenibacillus sp. GCM10027626]|uniref:AraC family transcriptional regulator n=1 Tax=Paenibacillus sp. GCM10027626 TaxID=3273411 RepID=UPI00363E1A15
MKYANSIIDPSERILILHSSNNDGCVPHSHEFIELVYISSGKGIQVTNGKSMFVSAGDLLLLSTPDEHSLHPMSGETEPFRWVNCIFLPEFIDFDFSGFSPENKYVGTEGAEFPAIFKAMIAEYDRKELGYLEVMRGYVRIVLIKLSRLLRQSGEEQMYRSRKMFQCVKSAVAFIHRNYYASELSLRTVTAHLSVSSSYLCKAFKEAKGVSVGQYIAACRIEQSCRLLTDTSESIQNIAHACGMRDAKFYHALFKRLQGMTPGEYRGKYRHSEPAAGFPEQRFRSNP